MSRQADTTGHAACERRHRLWRTVGFVTFAAGVVALTFAASASAGTYVIDNCPSAGSGDAGSWSVFGSPQNVKGTCSGGPGDFIGPRGGSMAPGTTAGVQIGVPPGSGITIIEAKVWWQASHQIAGADTFAIAAVNTGVVDESLTPMTGSEPSTFVLPSTTTEITLANYCSNDDAGAGCTFGSGVNNILELYGSRLTLDDTTLPAGSVTGGALASAAAVSGTTSISYQVTDPSSGVRLVQLRVDGEPAAEKDYLTSCSYTTFQACPPSLSDTVNWNSATVANGQHRIELVVESAAQNTSVIYSSEITVQNAAKTASSGALPGPGSPVVGVGSANGLAASEGADLRLGLPRAITRSYAHRAITVSGRLLDGQGHPIAHATLDILQQIDGSATRTVAGHATTLADGTFSARLPAGPSRLIDVGYRAYSQDTNYTAHAQIRETVAAGVRLRISPTRTGSQGSIVLSGTVEGPIPRHGTIVDLLVHYRGRWEPFRTPRTDRHGRFRVPYQFEGGVGRFPFRAEVPGGQAGFPFGSGNSRVVNVSTS